MLYVFADRLFRTLETTLALAKGVACEVNPFRSAVPIATFVLDTGQGSDRDPAHARLSRAGGSP